MTRTRGRYTGLGALLFILVLMADQYSKYWILSVFDLPAKGSVAILPFLNFTMVWNHAVTFGMFGNSGAGPWVFTAVALAVVAVLAVWVSRTTSALVAGALGAICGGAMGNVVDRMRFGAVVDFIHAHAFGWSWYVFNVGDSAIVCGVGVLLACNLREGHR